MQPFGAQNIIKSFIFAKPEDSSNTQVCQKTRKSFHSSNSKLLWKKSFDNRILNTMDSKIETIMEVLNGAKVSPVDSARYIRNILDAKPINSSLTDVQFISKVIEAGLNNIRLREIPFRRLCSVSKKQAAFKTGFHSGHSLHGQQADKNQSRACQAQLFRAKSLRLRGMAQSVFFHRLPAQQGKKHASQFIFIRPKKRLVRQQPHRQNRAQARCRASNQSPYFIPD